MYRNHIVLMILVIFPITAMESKKRGPEQELAESKEKKQKGDKSSEIFEEIRVLHKEISKEYQGKFKQECDKSFERIIELIKIRDAHEDTTSYSFLREIIEILKRENSLAISIHAETAENSLKAWHGNINMKKYEDLICAENLINMNLAEAEQQIDKRFQLQISQFCYEKISIAAKRKIAFEMIEEAKRYED